MYYLVKKLIKLKKLVVFLSLFLLVINCTSLITADSPETVSTELSDQTPPAFNSGFPVINDCTTDEVTISINTTESVTLYYILINADEKSPSIFNVLSLKGYNNVTIIKSGILNITGNEIVELKITGLSPSTKYDVYFTLLDNSQNILLIPAKLKVTTLSNVTDSTDTGKPFFSLNPEETDLSSDSITLKSKLNETGTIYYLVKDGGSVAPDSNAIISASKPNVFAGNEPALNEIITIIKIKNLQADTAYDIYLTAKDVAGNIMLTPSKYTFRTMKINDLEPPSNVSSLKKLEGDAKITLNWTDPLDNDLKGVEITYMPSNLVQQPVIILKGIQTLEITNLTNGTEYVFKVKTYDLSGNKSLEQTINATPVAPVFYTVTFDSVDGSAVANQNIISGGKISSPNIPVRNNYIFSGWYKEQPYLTEWKFSTDVVTSNRTLYAKWVSDGSDTTPPAEVSNLQPISGLRSISISWNEPGDVDYDKVNITYTGGTFNYLKNVKEAKIIGLNDNTEYTFTFKTYDTTGNESDGVSVKIKTKNPLSNYQPYIGPYLTLITPELNGSTENPTVLDPKSNMIVNYESNAASTFNAGVFYRKSGETTWLKKSEDIAEPLPNGMGKVHHITVSTLDADTIYEYQIISPEDNLSKIYSFKTASLSADSARFLAVSDMQDEEAQQRWADIATSITTNHLSEFDFILCLGDMASSDTEKNGDRYYKWKVFFDKGRDLFAVKPIFATTGNHDTPPDSETSTPEFGSNGGDSLSFRKYFNITTDQSKPDYYSFSYGNAYFIGVNSEIPIYYGKNPSKDTSNKRDSLKNWVQSETNGPAQTKKWAFGFSHVPLINPSGGKDEVQYLRPYTEYFNGKLDWFFSGHVHLYQRVSPVRATNSSLDFKNQYGRNADQGVGYLIMAPAGQWPRTSTASELNTQLSAYPHYKDNKSTYEIGFTIINVEGNNFSLKTYGLGDVNNRNNTDVSVNYNDNGQERLIDAVSYARNSTSLTSTLSPIYYAGLSSSWKKVPMLLRETNTWELQVMIPRGVTSGVTDEGYKFVSTSTGEKWYGDSNSDGKAQSDEVSNILFSGGEGFYTVRFNTDTRVYTAVKQ